jgi:hypothetical protein
LLEVIEDFNALPAVSALARVLINVANVRSFLGSMVASARGLEFNEDESGNVFAHRGQIAALSPNEAISADNRAYSRAVLVYTDAVAFLQHHG